MKNVVMIGWVFLNFFTDMCLNKKSLFRNIYVVLGLCSTEKSEVSSANNLVADVNPPGRSLIYTKKNIGLVWNHGELQL